MPKPCATLRYCFSRCCLQATVGESAEVDQLQVGETEKVQQVVEGAVKKLEGFLRRSSAERNFPNATFMQRAKTLPFMAPIGGPEGLCLLIKQASIDANGDGKIGPAEMERYAQVANEMINGANNALLNRGIIGALVLGVLFSLPRETFQADWDDLNTYGTVREFVLHLLAFVCLQIGIAASIMGLIYSSLVYANLNFRLPTKGLQLSYLLQYQKTMLLINVCEMTTVLSMTGYFMFITMADAGWLGFTGMLSAVGAIVAIFHGRVAPLINFIVPELIAEATRVLARRAAAHSA